MDGVPIFVPHIHYMCDRHALPHTSFRRPSMYSMFWFPQIILSAKRGRPSALSAEYFIGTSIRRLYFALCEGFHLEMDT